MRRTLTLLACGLLIATATSALAVTPEEFLALSGTKRKEVFKETDQWKEYGPLVYKIGAREGLADWELKLWMTMVWNESRFKPKAEGDNGCARGLGQVHVGGQTWKLMETVRSMDRRCPRHGSHGICPTITPDQGGDWVQSKSGRAYNCKVDNRNLFPTNHPVFGDMTKLAPEAFYTPEVGATASAIMFRQRIRAMGVTPFDAATSYAGCEVATGVCGKYVLSRLKWWWETGLDKALIKLENPKVAPLDQPSVGASKVVVLNP